MAHLLTIALILNMLNGSLQVAFSNITNATTVFEEDAANNHSLNTDFDSWIQPSIEEEPLNLHEGSEAKKEVADERPVVESPSMEPSEDEDSNQLLPSDEDDKSDHPDGCPGRCPDPLITSETNPPPLTTPYSIDTNTTTSSSGSTEQPTTSSLQPPMENHIPVEDPKNKETPRISLINTTDIKKVVVITSPMVKKPSEATLTTLPNRLKTNEIVTSELPNKSWATLSPPTVAITQVKTANWTKAFVSTEPDQQINKSSVKIKTDDITTATTHDGSTTKQSETGFVTESAKNLFSKLTRQSVIFPNTTTELPTSLPSSTTELSTDGITTETATESIFNEPTFQFTPTTNPMYSSESEKDNDILHTVSTSTVSFEADNDADDVTSEILFPRFTNINCLVLPVCIKAEVISEPSMCISNQDRDGTVGKAFLSMVGDLLDRYINPDIRQSQIVLEMRPCPNYHAVSSVVLFYVTDSAGEYEESLTSIAGVLLKRLPKAKNSVVQIVDVQVMEKDDGVVLSKEVLRVTPPPLGTPHSGMVAAVAISAVAGACLCLLCVLLIVMKHRLASQQMTQQQQQTQPMDSYSLDSFSINASFRRRPPGGLRNSAFLNHAFSHDADDTLPPSKPMTMSALASVLAHRRRMLEQEFEKLPMNTHKLDEVPAGAEGKNRYANVVPNPKTRVLLCDKSGDPVKSYINANYVRGQNGRTKFYIACQAPLNEHTADFWQMVWEQQSRLILMLTNLQENGISRCAAYFPESTLNCHQVHGNFEVSLLKKDVREFYTASTLKIVDGEKNSSREVRHLWYKAWPAVGPPSDPSSLVSFLLQARPFINNNNGPTIIHCSAGTGRTGVVVALDICMREFESLGCIDVVRCVTRIRTDRGGAVQNKDQYLLIHDALLEYAVSTANQSHRASLCSNN